MDRASPGAARIQVEPPDTPSPPPRVCASAFSRHCWRRAGLGAAPSAAPTKRSCSDCLRRLAEKNGALREGGARGLPRLCLPVAAPRKSLQSPVVFPGRLVQI